MFQLPNLTFNLALFGLAALLAVLGFMFGENRLKILSYGSFIALFIMTVVPNSFFEGLGKQIHIDIASPKLAFVAIVCAVFFLGAIVSQKKARFKIRSIPLGVITAVFIVAFCINLFPSGQANDLLTNYNLAAMISNVRIPILILLATWLAVIQFLPDKDKDDKK
jgi:hypothetical protein